MDDLSPARSAVDRVEQDLARTRDRPPVALRVTTLIDSALLPAARDLAERTGRPVTGAAEPAVEVMTPAGRGGLTEIRDLGPTALVHEVARFTQAVLLGAGRTWPRCPAHARHPVLPTDDGTDATWTCPRTPALSWPVGQLPDVLVEEPALPAGTVRWYVDEWGTGVIADRNGDRLFYAYDLVGGGPLAEGDRVRFRPEARPEGTGWHRATDVIAASAKAP